jgi:hypothetical protein
MSLESVESMATFEWQVRNSKRCPGCSALINREDGCNKMDCLNCGYEVFLFLFLFLFYLYMLCFVIFFKKSK